jgi:hypothetical protein
MSPRARHAPRLKHGARAYERQARKHFKDHPLRFELSLK